MAGPAPLVLMAQAPVAQAPAFPGQAVPVSVWRGAVLRQCAHCRSLNFFPIRPESFNSNIRMQNIFGNKQAPSRDIAVHFAVIEHLRFVCEGGYYNDKERFVHT